MGWISLVKLHDLYRRQPSWFALNEPLHHQNLATNSRKLVETLSAAYLRGDVRLFENRLWLVGGVRFEKTSDRGEGLLDDPSAQYQRDAVGRLVRNAAVQPILLTTDALARARLRYIAANAANGIPANTYNYQGHRFRMGLNAQYSFSKRLALYGSITDINGPGFTVINRQYAPGVPEHTKDRRRQELGSTIHIGVKGQF